MYIVLPILFLKYLFCKRSMFSIFRIMTVLVFVTEITLFLAVIFYSQFSLVNNCAKQSSPLWIGILLLTYTVKCAKF